MKIEDIEKLNREITQGHWENCIWTGDGVCARQWDMPSREIHKEFFTPPYKYVAIPATDNDKWFISYAPNIAKQYIRARRFKVTEDFTTKVKDYLAMDLSSFENSDLKYLFEGILEKMWEEVEDD